MTTRETFRPICTVETRIPLGGETEQGGTALTYGYNREGKVGFQHTGGHMWYPLPNATADSRDALIALIKARRGTHVIIVGEEMRAGQAARDAAEAQRQAAFQDNG